MKEPQIIQGIKCYAPELAHSSEDYPAGHAEKLYKIEAEHFWFRSRNRVLQYLFGKYLGRHEPRKILEVGCGTGFVLHGLARFSNFKLSGAELFIEGLEFAQTRLPNVDFVQLDFRDTPFAAEFDAVGAFDVLEHVEEDEQMIASAYTTLKPGGYFFISVPQHMWLWSTQDDTAFHKRRYSRREMKKKLQAAGFKIRFVSSFVFTLLPAMLLSRLRRKKSRNTKLSPGAEYSYDELQLPWALNALLNLIMHMDEFLIRLGVSLPAGGSLIVVAQKPQVAALDKKG
ncbi:SAM-dependent methyltransferase [Candidatus Peregrinibacteria bacterium CG11_big_fil_rev_8_21_14_0_20_46_8]|nr:MAG: SAM-dependent methyltransferase [Candidatus Peregrinibacteria bacterium CG11_big_fil_rev_8_21_14_0_20_46_8]